MQRVWLIQAGDDGEFLDSLRNAGIVGLPYLDVGDASDMAPAEIEQALIDANRSSPAQIRARLQSFVKDMKPGDLVITPNTRRHEVWLSIVTGDYRYDPQPSVDRYVHTRTVDWLGWLDRDARFMSDQLKAIDQPVALTELYNREWWWNQFDTKERRTAPRATWSKPTPTRAPRASSASKPKPASTPRPKPPTMVLCAGQCGLQWSPNVLVGGLCPDCRGD